MSLNFKKCRTIFLLVFVTTVHASTHCEQTWDDVKAPHYVSDTYNIHLLKINTTDEFRSFMPNTKYQVLIKADEDERLLTRFYITVENENKSLSHGTLELYDKYISEFSQICPDSIVQVSQVLKDEISTYWTSPEEGNGCVIFRASIMESPSMWFMDGSLEKKFCQDPKATVDDPGPILPECCACDEAKYELSFEGLWSRYTHPKNFPSKPWNARFSDIVGASHTTDYRFWVYNETATDGMKQIAENGITTVLESELKNKSEDIRTIIKARGINFPNITSKTFAVFRVDQKHHLVSLVSMIDPSPDWFVGVSGLELCLPNCSWIAEKELNLYPIDAGTDDGVSYESVNSETDPREVIRRITTTWPEDEGSPFYDEAAIDMNPLAKLYITRQRIYEKDCANVPENVNSEGDEEANRPIRRKACKATEWSEWEPCSVSCGQGIKLRRRKYKNERSAVKHNCNTLLINQVPCYSDDQNPDCVPSPLDEVDEERCPLSQWTDWSRCTKSCGPENRIRDRNFLIKRRRKHCRHDYPQVSLQETLDCENPACETSEVPGGEGESADEETVSENRETAETSDSTTDRANNEVTEENMETEASVREREITVENLQREDLGGAENRHELTEKKRRRKKCLNSRYTPWSFWSPCSVSCGRGTRSRLRHILPEWTDSSNADTDGDSYDCQHEFTTCVADTKSCELTPELREVICSQSGEAGYCTDGHNDNSLRYYFDNLKGKCTVFHYTGCNGNMNNFRTRQECLATCGNFDDENGPEPKSKKRKNRGSRKSNSMNLEKVDCEVSEWSNWSPCYGCKGYRTMNRDILSQPQNGGKLCPTKLIRKQKCHKVLDQCGAQNVPVLNRRSRNETELMQEE